jgi:mono/diheme cytochrome c family protein
MKKIFALLFVSTLIACGSSNDKKEDGFKFKRKQKEEVQAQKEKTATPIDLSNVGIGPIKKLAFDSDIDLEMVETGRQAFKAKCTACHKTDKKLIGPAMKGIYERRHPAWVMNMLLNPTEMVKEDPIAKALLAEYNNILMINQNLSNEEARAIAEYLRTL